MMRCAAVLCILLAFGCTVQSDPVQGFVDHMAATAKPSVNYDRFVVAFDALNDRVEQNHGVRLFLSSRDLGDGIIEVTAADVWLLGTEEERRGNLRTIFDLWATAEATGLPIAVYVVDRRGNQIMSMNRGLQD